MRKNLIIVLLLATTTSATEIVFKFGSPSFSGINQSAHYLTIDELEGNIIQWLNNGTTITLTIIEMLDGVEISRTTITIPVGSFGGCTSDCG